MRLLSVLLCASFCIPLSGQYLKARFPAAFANVFCLNIQTESEVRFCRKLSRVLNAHVYCKEDGDLRYPAQERLFGGNKVRKLNFVLAEAAACDEHGDALYDGLVAFGGIGSNLTLATAACASQLGKPVVMVMEEHTVQPDLSMKLKLGKLYGAQHMLWPDNATQVELVPIAASKFGFKRPYHVTVGASTPLGILGFVDAGLELAAQVEKGLLPKPDAIYLACGSMGTTVGLLIGLQIAGLDTHVVAVKVGSMAREEAVERLFNETIAYMREQGFDVSMVTYAPQQYTLRYDFLGAGYAQPLPGHAETCRLMGLSDIKLDATYTGKAAACLVSDARQGSLKGKNILFWQTYCSDDFSDQVQGITADQFPEEFRKYIN